MENPPSLSALIGETITVKILSLKPDGEFQAKLIAVENSGIWIEYIELSQRALELFNKKDARKTMIFFVPFSSLSFVVESLDAPTLSETMLSE